MLPERETEKRHSWRSWAPFAILGVVVFGIWAVTGFNMRGDEGEPREIPYSELKSLVGTSAGQIESVEFDADSNRIDVRLSSGENLRSAYTTEASASELESLLDERGVEYSAKERSDNAWWSFATYLLPFLLFFGFWVVLLRTRKRDQAPTDGLG